MSLGIILALIAAFGSGVVAGAFIICLLVSSKLPPQ